MLSQNFVLEAHIFHSNTVTVTAGKFVTCDIKNDFQTNYLKCFNSANAPRWSGMQLSIVYGWKEVITSDDFRKIWSIHVLLPAVTSVLFASKTACSCIRWSFPLSGVIYHELRFQVLRKGNQFNYFIFIISIAPTINASAVRKNT